MARKKSTKVKHGGLDNTAKKGGTSGRAQLPLMPAVVSGKRAHKEAKAARKKRLIPDP